MSAEAPPTKRRKFRCGNCGEEGHNKTTCLRNAQAGSSSQPANTQPSENRSHAQASRRWRNIGEIDDEKVEEDTEDGRDSNENSDAEDIADGIDD